MRNILFVCIITIIVITGCGTEKTSFERYFMGNEWLMNGETYFRNDSSISYKHYDFNQEKLVGDTAFPMQLNDTVVIYKQVREKGIYNNGVSFTVTGDTIITDTAFYDFIYINKKPRLIIYLQSHPKILRSKNKITPPVTNHFERASFTINGYTIGDIIDVNLLKTKGIYSYNTYSIEDCELKNNRDIKMKIIGNNQIYSIERHNIPDYRISDAIKVINNKLGTQPDYFPQHKRRVDSNYEYEFYSWKAKGVRIKIERSKYIGKEVYMNLFDNDKWTLFYDDEVEQAVLVEQYTSGDPTSTIIN